jgi:hypothetical protein
LSCDSLPAPGLACSSCNSPIESVSIAVDQSFGHAADPASSVVSLAIVPVFVVLALVGLVPLFFDFRNLHRRNS